MRVPEAYKQPQTIPQPRIDIVIALYRKALEHLQHARQVSAEDRTDDARRYLVKAQLIVNSLASGMAGSTEEISINFLRLYEFVSERLARGGMADIDSAQRVLETLRNGFEEARNQAIALEAAGTLPTFGAQHTLHVTT